ncbi:NnrU family protein [Minwuia thermotolerans]|uniref:NnrU domain-containing protein n=1 Tax=Minwuia thermotolerans TaxID=2056226 RepID=A0A2M9FX05_9PROT|nr:NnrU family protein [Minwuia thermotolerans]PJK27984.1 hypothetical protein CVT23_19850 [Minwuia thermotolerans]
MTNLAAALALLFLTHAAPSLPALRERLLARLGVRAFRIAYSLVSLAAVAWVIQAYAGAADSPWVWSPPLWARWAAVLAMPLALWLVAVRLMRPPGKGAAWLYRLVPAPASAGILLWALLHLANVGQARALLLFAVFAAIALFALVKNMLTAAPVAGSAPDRVGYRPAAAALAVWAALLALHPLVIGPDPLAWLALPG